MIHPWEKPYGIPQAKVSIAYDVLNHIILDFRVAHCDTSEIPLSLCPNLPDCESDPLTSSLMVLGS